ncbi:MAG: sodium-translocating pyrophosphatase [Candidatus Aenigmatarchaeota archaeon]
MIPLIASVFALVSACILIIYLLKQAKGSGKMIEIHEAIKEGSMSYLNRQYKTVAVIAIILAVVIAISINVPTAVTFVFGALSSALAGYVGMNISIRANVRTAEAAKKGLSSALGIAFKGGAVTGLFVVGLALLGLTVFYDIYGEPLLIVGFGFGACLISLFARIGGGIYTKAADVGADLVGKVEAGIPEDDPRNPAVIADQVGDNVGDCAGMGADLFETYAVTAVGAMLLGSLVLGNAGIVYPLMLGAVAIFASVIGIFFVRVKENIMNALYKGVIATGIISAVLFYFVAINMALFYCSLIGIIIAILLFVITEYYTTDKFAPVKSIVEASKTGAGTNIITGLAVGMQSTVLPVLVISAGILASYYLANVYGIAIAAMAMLSLTGMIIALDSYGPITDNAGGIAEMSNLNKRIRNVTDRMDAVGNTTKAVTKSFAIGSAALAALTLFAAYVKEVEIAKGAQLVFSIGDPLVLVGLFIGALIPFLFSSLCMQAVGKTAFKVVEEVRAQFKGIFKGKAKPNYGRCVDIVTKSAIKEMTMPALLAVISPLLVGFLLGPKALGGLLLGSIISGLLLALMLTTGGAAWDNAKKSIEKNKGKGTDTHKAAVVGDTVGDPCKDTAGPAINPLIKVMNTIAIIFIQLIVAFAIF